MIVEVGIRWDEKEQDAGISYSSCSNNLASTPNNIQVIKRHAVISSSNPGANDSREVDCFSRDMGSSLTTERSSRRPTLLMDDPSLTAEERSQLSMWVQRKGQEYGPNMPNSSISSGKGGSIPSGVVLEGGYNADASSGALSTMVKSFDESGSHRCVRNAEGSDGEDGFSVNDLSGFSLSDMGTRNTASSRQSK